MSIDNTTGTSSLYLDLIKRSLTGALAEDNDSILGGVRTQGSPLWRKRLANSVGHLASRFNVEIVYKKPYDPQLREIGWDWPARAESMIGLRRMDNIEHCVRTVLEDDVPGDLIETGVWRGGACIFMKANLMAGGDTTRNVWVADSFQGLPKPNSTQFPADAGDALHKRGGLSIGADRVRHNFERYGVLDERVKFLVGWFKDTLPTAPIEALSVMRLDGDMYESTWQAIEALYPKLSPGGFCIIDDFGSHQSQAGQAVHDYRRANGIDEPIMDIDGFGAYWRRRALVSAAQPADAIASGQRVRAHSKNTMMSPPARSGTASLFSCSGPPHCSACSCTGARCRIMDICFPTRTALTAVSSPPGGSVSGG